MFPPRVPWPTRLIMAAEMVFDDDFSPILDVAGN